MRDCQVGPAVSTECYAHSFLDFEDLPCFGRFLIALFLFHRAFRQDTFWALVLCGMRVGRLPHIRIMGVMRFPSGLALGSLDFDAAAKM